MATFSTVPLDEARRSVLPPRKATQELYRQYVRSLSPDEAGQLELGPDDNPITERARLKAAAKAEGVNLRIQRKGNTIVFWETDEPPKTRGKAGGGGRGRKRAGSESGFLGSPYSLIRCNRQAGSAVRRGMVNTRRGSIHPNGHSSRTTIVHPLVISTCRIVGTLGLTKAL
jgi:hypothetical protein